MKREGSLHEAPFPELFSAIIRDGRSCTLELRARQLEKRIVFEDGAPVSCASNLLHETLGKYLVERGRITEEQYRAALAGSAATGKQMGELLVERQLISPYDLYKQLQSNLARKILDCFRWAEGTFRILPGAEESKSALRMNAAQIVLTGVSNILPFEIVEARLPLPEGQRFAAVPEPPEFSSELRLSGREARFHQALRGRPTFAELAALGGFDAASAHRKLYALMLLGWADVAERVPEGGVQRSEAISPPPAPQAQAGVSFVDEDASVCDALMAAFLEHRSRDPFALLGVAEDVQPQAVRKVFLELLERFAPIRFRTPELREKAEAMAVAWAKAASALMDPEQAAHWRRRKDAAREKERATRPRAAEQFRIRTDLLDARAQFDEARKRLAAGSARQALELFAYACDIDPRPQHRAWRAWAEYQVDPDRNARAALRALGEVCAEEGAGEDAFRFAGQIHRGLGQVSEAEACFRKADALRHRR